MAGRSETQDHVLWGGGLRRHLLQLSGNLRAVLFPQGFFDFFPLSAPPDEPPTGRLRVYAQGGGLYTLDDAGATAPLSPSWRRLSSLSAAVTRSTPAAEQDMASFTIPGGTMDADGRRLRLLAFGSGAPNVDGYFWTLKLDGSTVGPQWVTLAGGESRWLVRLDVVRQGASSGRWAVEVVASSGGTAAAVHYHDQGALAFSWASDRILKVTVQDEGGTGTPRQDQHLVEVG